jgi:error-prone DNA polymerase
MNYAELHCHSYYSFHDGASSLEELMVRARDLGYAALAVTDHDNLCGAMEFARLAKSLGLHGIIGAEVTLEDGHHLTLLVRDRRGYGNLCRLITAAHAAGERNEPALAPSLLPEHADGLIALSGCPRGEMARLVALSRFGEAAALARRYLDWFGPENYYVELQQNLAYGDTERNRRLAGVAREAGARLAATGNVHYHDRERHRLQDCLVAIRHGTSLEESHRERRANSEYYLRPVSELEALFKEYPEALANTVEIAGRCTFDLTADHAYVFPDYQVPAGYTPQTYLETLCYESAIRRYGSVTAPVRRRLEEEFRLIKKFNLAGFLLMYHEVIKLGGEVMVDLGLSDASLTVEENPPGRGRGSSVALLVGYLIGLSHIDPLQYGLSLERFLPEDGMAEVPDIDLDFPRSIREELILRTHEKWGWERAVLTGTIATYRSKGAVRDLGQALGLPPAEIDQLARQVDWGSARKLREKMERMPNFREKIDAPVWRDLVALAVELDGFPKYLGQHPGGMILSSGPLTEIVPVQRGAIDGRYVCQWDKDSVDDAGFVKIDFLALGALSQMQEAVELIRQRTGEHLDLSRIDFEDDAVYDMLCSGDAIGIFQVESAAQLQTITRLRPRNLLDMAHEVASVRPGVGVNNGVYEYLARRNGHKPVVYGHPLERRALERTHGIILFQDQVNQLAIDVAGFSPSEADRLRRAFSRKHNTELLEQYRRQFLAGAAERGVAAAAAGEIFQKFTGQYMFPESHAFAFGVTAFQASWLKYYYPLEFFVAIFNQQPMGFYNLETLKEDARRHGIRVLNPDVNRSRSKSVIEGRALRLGFLHVDGLGPAAAEAIAAAQQQGPFTSTGDFLERTGLLEETALNLAGAGAFDSLQPNRRAVKWEIGLRYRPLNVQLPLPLPVTQDIVPLEAPGAWERMKEEYGVLGIYPEGHIMGQLRPRFGKGFVTSRDLGSLRDGAAVTAAGMVIRRQRPRGKVVFITLEDEFGHIPCMVFGKTYRANEFTFHSPFLVVKGRLTRKEGTCNVVVRQVESFRAIEKVPASKDWQ